VPWFEKGFLFNAAAELLLTLTEKRSACPTFRFKHCQLDGSSYILISFAATYVDISMNIPPLILRVHYCE
jgi:hypothetical protein